ncbi:hypothetical protein [Streptomyces sp. SID9727]|uniref:hypothetical protein n=1 Tax=Streptomyces sp. SID9727 TaxID=2706114 RepID=UPI0013CA5EF5|nr:hypothetical protein [Streptomyces sp. SID9727]NEC68545.1 hypothetical protein [Streptomyces sp. SID9727]
MQWAERQHFDRGSSLMQGWGVLLLLITCALWVRVGFLIWDTEDRMYCFRASSICKLETTMPEQLTLLGISAPLAVAGTGLLVAGSVRRQTSAHVLRVIEMQQSEERARTK